MKWPTERRQNWKQAQPEFSQLSDVSLVNGEVLALLTCTCIRVGKSRPLNIIEISLLLATGCSCFDRKLGLYNRCTSGTHLPTGVLRVPTKYLTTTIRRSAGALSIHIAEPGGRWVPQHVSNKVGGAN